MSNEKTMEVFRTGSLQRIAAALERIADLLDPEEKRKAEERREDARKYKETEPLRGELYGEIDKLSKIICNRYYKLVQNKTLPAFLGWSNEEELKKAIRAVREFDVATLDVDSIAKPGTKANQRIRDNIAEVVKARIKP